jgi:ABC-type branched-subunit amino acid transport system substrate-binding protein
MTTSLGFAVADYLTKADIPVVGAAIDGPEWISALNMFSVFGPIHTELVDNTTGLFLKQQGVTKLGTLGYSISPTSSQAAKGAAASAQSVGLQAPYVNASFQFGSTDVQPIALAMKKDGVDGIIPTTESQTSFALINALRNLGVPPKVALLAEGYGSDLIDAGAATQKSAQDTYYELQQEPIEMQTPATKTFLSYLSQSGGGTHPNLGAYEGYMSILLLVQGLQGAPQNPTSGQLVASLAKISAFTAGGLYGDKTVDVNDRVGVSGGPAHCLWMVKFEGTTFHLVQGADPICGAQVQGKKIS